MTYLLFFFVFLFFIRVPFFFLRLFFRFSKPMALIGFGCLLGTTAAAGWPDLSELDSLTPDLNNAAQSTGDLTEQGGSVGPKLLEAALGLAERAEDSLSTVFSDLQSSWNTGTERKITTARNHSAREFGSLAGSLWERKKQR